MKVIGDFDDGDPPSSKVDVVDEADKYVSESLLGFDTNSGPGSPVNGMSM